MGPLQELRTYLEAQEVHADALQVGAALLALARTQQWNKNPDEMVSWLEDLAMDVARNWRHSEAEAAAAESGIETVPIAKLKKIALSASTRAIIRSACSLVIAIFIPPLS